MMQQQKVRVQNADDDERFALLVMAYGTPSSLDDVERYLTHIRNGKKPTPEEVARLRARYAAIGGKSPLLEITNAQAKALEDELTRRRWAAKSFVGMLHSPPFVEDVVKEILAEKLKTIVTVPLTAYYSTLSTRKYEDKVAESLKQSGFSADLLLIRSWNTHPGFIRAWAEKIAAKLPLPSRPAMVVFTAHSLPSKILEWKDPYPSQIQETCRLIAEAVGLDNWTLAYQSVGMAGGEWLGPEILEVLSDLGSKGHHDLIIAPVGFVSDHLEVLYDIDIECQGFAKRNGIKVERVGSLNTSPTFISALASIVEERLELAGKGRTP